MPKDVEILKTLTSFFYDLAKEVPIGVLNRMLMNTIVDKDEVRFCDEDLMKWAKKFAEQLIDYRTKFTHTQLHLMGFDNTISKNGKSVCGS
jgi:hypothetical protein